MLLSVPHCFFHSAMLLSVPHCFYPFFHFRTACFRYTLLLFCSHTRYFPSEMLFSLPPCSFCSTSLFLFHAASFCTIVLSFYYTLLPQLLSVPHCLFLFRSAFLCSILFHSASFIPHKFSLFKTGFIMFKMASFCSTTASF
jgi:hypothetical protein